MHNFENWNINPKPAFFYNSYVLFYNENKRITVTMAINIIDFEIDLIAIKYPGIEKYKMAKLLLEACKMFYQNQTPPKISKKNLKIAVDAILEIKNDYSFTEEEKRYNAFMAFIIKFVIDISYYDRKTACRWF